MKSRTKIKVDRRRLLKELRARKAAAEKRYEAALARHEREIRRWAERAVRRLRREADRIERTGEPSADRYGYTRSIDVGSSRPDAPVRVRYVGRLDKLIGALELSTEDTISLTPDEVAEYVGESKS